jgi:FkbM family methyltransferase
MNRLLRRALLLRERVILYQHCFGKLRGGAIAVAARSPRWNGRRVRTHSTSGPPVLLRVGTTDVDVYRQVMVDREYECNLSVAPEVIIDAGAHIGLASIWFATRYPNALIVAVEPETDNFELLVANTVAYPNVQAVRAALWVTDGDVDLLDPGWGTWGFRIGDRATGDNKKVVCGVSLPRLMDRFRLDHIDLLKLDIEGSEVEVFSQCSSWIDQVEGIVVELHDRIRPGCSRAFFGAVRDFTHERWNGEHVLVTRV